jgi:hypothetical protein
MMVAGNLSALVAATVLLLVVEANPGGAETSAPGEQEDGNGVWERAFVQCPDGQAGLSKAPL